MSTILSPSDELLEIGPLDPSLTKEIREIAPQRHVTLEKKDCESTLSTLDIFDVIICREAEVDIEHKKKVREEVHLVLEQGKQLLKSVSETVPEIAQIRYSDRDLQIFCEEVGKFHLHHLSQFISQLRHNGQITPEQQQWAIAKYGLDKVEIKRDDLEKEDSIFPLVQACLTHHMRKGSRLFGLLLSGNSKYEDAQFFEQIITNPFFDYKEIEVVLGGKKILAMLIEKQR